MLRPADLASRLWERRSKTGARTRNLITSGEKASRDCLPLLFAGVAIFFVFERVEQATCGSWNLTDRVTNYQTENKCQILGGFHVANGAI